MKTNPENKDSKEPIFKEEIVIDSYKILPEYRIDTEELKSFKSKGMTYEDCVWNKLGSLKKGDLQKKFIEVQLKKASNPDLWIESLMKSYSIRYKNRITPEASLLWEHWYSQLGETIESFTTEKPSSKFQSFDISESKLVLLDKVLRKLNDVISLIDPLKCSFEDLMMVFKTDDLSSEDLKIVLRSETVVFARVLKEIKPKFPTITFTNIEKSQVFYSRYGKLISRSSLSSSLSQFTSDDQSVEDIVKSLISNH